MPDSKPLNLYAVLLGGRAKGCNIELHDVQFTIGLDIKECYTDLLSKWFGIPDKMHLDSYMKLNVVDGYEISLAKVPPKHKEKLFFVNLGAYEPGVFSELHATKLLVDTSKISVKKRAKEALLVGKDSVHTDDLYDVDDCLAITSVNGWHVHLTPTDKSESLIPTNGYMPLPKRVVQEFMDHKF